MIFAFHQLFYLLIKKLPHTFIIIFYLILIAAAMTWVIPGGKYTEEVVTTNEAQQKQMVFHYTENVRQRWQVFSSFYKGFVKQAGIIIFIMLIRGAFWIFACFLLVLTPIQLNYENLRTRCSTYIIPPDNAIRYWFRYLPVYLVQAIYPVFRYTHVVSHYGHDFNTGRHGNRQPDHRQTG
jgi:hypothetical protein